MNCCCSCTCCFGVFMGAGLLIGWCLFFHFDKDAFYTFYSMHFSMDSAGCQEEMHAVKCMKKGIKGIESSYFLLHLITILYASMHRWSFLIFINKDNKIRKQSRKCIKDNSLKTCPSSKLLWVLNGTQQYTPLPSLNKTKRISNHTSAELSYLTAGMVWACNKHQVKHIS